jgi:hypothetical protein
MFRNLNCRLPIISLLIITLGQFGFCYFVATRVFATPQPLPSATPIEEEQPVPLKDYRDILEKERKLLEEQSKAQYDRIERFAYVVVSALGVALTAMIALFTWIFGQTKNEAVNNLKSYLETSVLPKATGELERVKRAKVEEIESQYNILKERLERISSIGKQRVVWLLTEGMAKPTGEIAALQAVGLQNVESIAPKVGAKEEINKILNDADLVIVTYNSTPDAKTLLRNVAATIKFRQPPISLLIYTYGFTIIDQQTNQNKQVQIDTDSLEYLKDLGTSFAPAQFPATLVSQAQSLIVKNKYL